MIRFSDLALRLGVTRPTVTGWVRRGLPWHGTERCKQFEPAEVRDWLVREGLADRPTPAEPEIDAQAIARNRHEVANHFGVDLRTVATWLTDPTFPGRSGKPGRRDGYFPLGDIATWWAAKRGNTPGAVPGGSGPQDRIVLFRGDLLELDLQKRRGELVDAGEMHRLLVRHIKQVRSVLDSLPEEFLAALPTKTPRKLMQRIRKILRRRLDAAYHAFAEMLEGDTDQVGDSNEGES